MSQMWTETSTIGVVMQAPETTIEEEPTNKKSNKMSKAQKRHLRKSQ